MNLKIHNPCNKHTRYYRHYNYFWDKLTDELKEKHSVLENRYFEKANSERFPVKLLDGTETLLMECEYLIENIDTGDIYVLSVSDDLSHATLDLQNNPRLKKVLISQFYRKKIASHVGANIKKYSPWIYFHSDYSVNLLNWRTSRDKISSYTDKLFFRGSNLESRPILQHFNSTILTGPNSIGGSDPYFNDAIHHIMGLSIAGRGEFCYRDIEYMAIGIPMIRFEYQSELYRPLIPDYHYISIPYPEDMPLNNGLPTDRLGMRQHAQMIENKFLNVLNDIEYLKYISDNAKKYYDNYLTLKNSIDLTLNLLNL
jgi:hypothetical protein